MYYYMLWATSVSITDLENGRFSFDVEDAKLVAREIKEQMEKDRRNARERTRKVLEFRPVGPSS